MNKRKIMLMRMGGISLALVMLLLIAPVVILRSALNMPETMVVSENLKFNVARASLPYFEDKVSGLITIQNLIDNGYAIDQDGLDNCDLDRSFVEKEDSARDAIKVNIYCDGVFQELTLSR